jgi:hypothetical protein
MGPSRNESKKDYGSKYSKSNLFEFWKFFLIVPNNSRCGMVLDL